MAIAACAQCGGKVSTRAASCPHCGTPVAGAGAPASVKLGAPPTYTCRECGWAPEQGARFCRECGSPVPPGVILAVGAPGVVAVPVSSAQQTVLIVLGVVLGGFALIVMIGILAAIAIPKFASTKEKAYVAAMKSDLRNLVTAEERFFADSVTYTPSLPAALFVPSTGVTVRIVDASRTGWRATATSRGTTRTCSIFVGGSGQVAGQLEGEPKCQ